MRLPTGVKALFALVALIALFAGVLMLSDPTQFSGAEVGDAVECDSGVCQVIDVDDSEWGVTIVEFSDLPRTVLFEGTEEDVRNWTSQEHINATRPIAIAWLVGATVFGALALTRRKGLVNDASK